MGMKNNKIKENKMVRMSETIPNCIGFTMGILWVQFSNTIPLPINTITIVGEGMALYMFGYGVIPKNIKLLHCPSSCQPHGVAGCVLAGGG